MLTSFQSPDLRPGLLHLQPGSAGWATCCCAPTWRSPQPTPAGLPTTPAPASSASTPAKSACPAHSRRWATACSGGTHNPRHGMLSRPHAHANFEQQTRTACMHMVHWSLCCASDAPTPPNRPTPCHCLAQASHPACCRAVPRPHVRGQQHAGRQGRAGRAGSVLQYVLSSPASSSDLQAQPERLDALPPHPNPALFPSPCPVAGRGANTHGPAGGRG